MLPRVPGRTCRARGREARTRGPRRTGPAPSGELSALAPQAREGDTEAIEGTAHEAAQEQEGGDCFPRKVAYGRGRPDKPQGQVEKCQRPHDEAGEQGRPDSSRDVSSEHRQEILLVPLRPPQTENGLDRTQEDER